ncbi:MAG: translocation/assembly module TamB, partial [Parachlamydia sp.]|nr:translocation/assembly module TamB [Parachlamydia sp.]
QSPHLVFKERELRDANVTILYENGKGEVNGSATLLDLPCQISCLIDQGPQTIDITDIKGTLSENSFNGHLSYLLDHQLWKGELSIKAQSLDKLPLPVKMPMKGTAYLEMKLDASLGRQYFNLAASGENIAAEGISVHQFTAQLGGEYRDQQLEWAAEHASLKGFSVNGHVFESLSMHFKDENFVEVEGKDNEKKLSFLVSGTLTLEPFIQFDLLQAKGVFDGSPFSSLAPFTLNYREGILKIPNIQMRYDTTAIHADFSLANDQIDLAFSSPSLALNQIKYPLNLEGTASINGRITGHREKPEGTVKVNFPRFVLPEGISANPLTGNGSIQLQLKDNSIYLESRLNGIGRSPLFIQGHLPYRLELPFQLIETGNEFALNIKAEGPVEPFLEMLFKNPIPLSGQTQLDLQVTGTWQDPRLQGSIELKNGMYEPDGGSRFHHISARLEGEGSKLVLKNFSAENDQNGSLTGRGYFQLDKQEDFPFDIWLNPKNLLLMDSESTSLAASGTLHLTGNRKKAHLEGELMTESAQIDLEGTLPKPIKTLEVQYINSPAGSQTPSYESSTSFSNLEFNIKLHLRNHVMIEGKKLTSRWKGIVLIAGSPQSPLLYGDLRMSEGDYNFNGKIFKLTQGAIHFNGAPGKKTGIYVVASREIGKIRADIIVKGPVNKLAVTFRSNPPLSQREILSYILFNRGISNITPEQGDQLNQSFIELNSSDASSGEEDFLTRLRKNIGLFDRLDILPQSFQAGRFLMEGVYISFDRTKDMGNRVIVEADVLKHFKAQAEIPVYSEGQQQKYSLKWKKDY